MSAQPRPSDLAPGRPVANPRRLRGLTVVAGGRPSRGVSPGGPVEPVATRPVAQDDPQR